MQGGGADLRAGLRFEGAASGLWSLQGSWCPSHPNRMCLQEAGVPAELLVAVLRPGLPTLADLHVLLPTRKQNLSIDKVGPGGVAWGPGGRWVSGSANYPSI